MSATQAKVTRQGSGRTKGSFSFVKIPLSQIADKFKDVQTPVVVSRKWAESVGFTGLTAQAANHTLSSIEGTTPAAAAPATVVDFDAQEAGKSN
jgi:hypothetical protein